MRFRLCLIIAFSISMFCVSVVFSQVGISPELMDTITYAELGEFVPVIFIMKEQIDVDNLYAEVADLARIERREYALRLLQEVAASSQVYLIADLERLEKAGKTNRIRPLWISNMIAAQVNTGEIQPLLHRHSEIHQVILESPRIGSLKSNISSTGSVIDEIDEMGWGVDDIHAPMVWNLGYRGQNVLIAGIDTGVDYNHPDLADHIWVNPFEDLNGNGIVDPSDWNDIDDDHNGYTDDLRGWDFEHQSPDVMDIQGNGTAAAGIILGDGTGGVQTGTAPRAKLMILKNLSGGESAYWEAVQYAVDMGADIVTSSLAYRWHFVPQPNYAAMREVMQAAFLAGLICSNSIGNEGDNLIQDPMPFNIAAPASCPPPWLHPDQTIIGGISSVLAIGAYYDNYELAPYSGVGPSAWNLDDILSLSPGYVWQSYWLPDYNDYPYNAGMEIGLIKPDLTAPTDVVTTQWGGGYMGYYAGTEAAAPHAAGALCLMLSANPYASPEALAEAVMTSAEEMGVPGKNNLWGCGRLNAFTATAAILAPISGTLTGFVTDSATSLAIPETVISIPAQNTFTQTDSSGSYLYPGITEGERDVRFTAAGYDTLWVCDLAFTIGEVETLDVALTASVGIADPHDPLDIPHEFAVGRCYPNPFNAETVIPLELPQRSRVIVDIFDVSGRKVWTISTGVQNAGYPRINYNASRLSSGVYFYRITARGLERGDTYQSVGKMLLLK